MVPGFDLVAICPKLLKPTYKCAVLGGYMYGAFATVITRGPIR